MKNGFALIPGVLGALELESVSRALAGTSLKRSRAGVRHLLSIPAIATLARDPRLLELATHVLGSKPVPFGATLFDKSAEANWLVVWHQDRALPLLARRDVPGWGPWSEKGGIVYAHAPAAALEQVVALRVHLDDSTADNGPLRVLPGTHRLGVLSDERIQAAAQRLEPVACTLPRGGVLAMRPLLIHASSKAATAAPRRVIHFEYAASPVLANGLLLRAA
jgi:hypothetical protein